MLLNNKCITYTTKVMYFTADDFLNLARKTRANRGKIDDIQNRIKSDESDLIRCASIKQAILENILLPIPYINLTGYGIEVDGFHRMVVCKELFKPTQTYPVMIIARNKTN